MARTPTPQRCMSARVSTQQSRPSSSRGPEAVIFLDVDGVLHSLYGNEMFTPSCCSLLVQIVRSTGASIVLSSAWRTQARSYDMVNQILRQLKLASVIDKTKDLSAAARRIVPREFEICEWLDRHPGVRRWIAIDDMDLHTGPNEAATRLRGHFVHTNPRIGLTKANAELAVKLMQRQGGARY